MSDINELIHAIRLAERLAEGVAHEDESLSFEHLVNVRKSLAAATIHIEMAALRAGVDLIEDHAVLDDRLHRAMTAIAEVTGVATSTDPYASLESLSDQLECATDPANRARLREMIDARTKAA